MTHETGKFTGLFGGLTALLRRHHQPASVRANNVNPTAGSERVERIVAEAKILAKRYHRLTGRPLGITGEIAEYEAARLLGLRLAEVRQDGYDAIRECDAFPQKLQIKGRRLVDQTRASEQIGAINTEKEWDGVLLVLLNVDFDPLAIYEANRAAIVRALEKPGSKARNERGALAVSTFKEIGWQVWPPATAPGSDGRRAAPCEPRAPFRPHDRNQRSRDLVLVGYFLARCGSGEARTNPPAKLGVRRWNEVYPLFHKALSQGRPLSSFRNSLQATRDAFDYHVENGRIGFRKPLGNLQQAIFDEWQPRSCDELWAAVRPFVTPNRASE